MIEKQLNHGDLIAIGQNTIDRLGNKEYNVYDGDGREVVRYDPNRNATTTTYDAASRVSSVTDRDGRQMVYRYDNDNRVTEEFALRMQEETGCIVADGHRAVVRLNAAVNRSLGLRSS